MNQFSDDKLDKYDEFKGKGYYNKQIPLYTIPDKVSVGMKKAYYACTSYVDYQIGRVMEELR